MSNSMKAMPVVRGMSQSFCIVVLLLTCCTLSAQNASGPDVNNNTRACRRHIWHI
jgi:hypothetical protein